MAGREPPERPTPRRTTTEGERIRLEEERAALADQKRALERLEAALVERWPEDVSRPISIGTVPAIDWSRQPAIPAEKIDWSHLGEPLRVRPSLGGYIAAIGVIASVLGGAAMLVQSLRSHMTNTQIHLDPAGEAWGTSRHHETREEAAKARDATVSAVKLEISTSYEKLKKEVLPEVRRRSR